MAVTLFSNRNRRGESERINNNRGDLRNSAVGYRTTSAELTNRNDQVLLFSQRNFGGRALFLNGRANIDRVGRPADGGKTGFNNSARSARMTPFRIDVIYHIVRDGDGNNPGGINNMNNLVTTLHNNIRGIWSNFMIDLRRRRINTHDSDRFFNMRGDYTALLTNRSMSVQNDALNIFLVNTTNGAIGRAAPRLSVRTIVQIDGRNNAEIARTTAHEIGHIFFLNHNNRDGTNLMAQTRIGNGLNLDQRQVERVHQRLANRTGVIRRLRR